jgi:hypothetical protein
MILFLLGSSFHTSDHFTNPVLEKSDIIRMYAFVYVHVYNRNVSSSRARVCVSVKYPSGIL